MFSVSGSGLTLSALSCEDLSSFTAGSTSGMLLSCLSILLMILPFVVLNQVSGDRALPVLGVHPGIPALGVEFIGIELRTDVEVRRC